MNVNVRHMEVQPMERDAALSAFNAFLGIWLVATCFLWKHSTASLVNTVVIAAACIAVALVSMRAPGVRWLYVPLSAWTVASAWIVPLQDTTASVTLVSIGTALFLAPVTMRWLGQDDPREVVRTTDEV